MMTIILILFGACLLAIAAPAVLRWPVLLAFAVLFSMEFNYSGRLDLAFLTISNLLKTLLMVVFLIRLLIDEDRLRIPKFLMHLIPLLILTGIGVLHSEMFSLGVGNWGRWLYIWTFTIILSNVIRQERHILWVSHIMALAIILVAGSATVQGFSFFSGGPTLIEVHNMAMQRGLRASGGFFSPNTMALHLVGMLIFIFAQFPDLKWRSWAKPLYIVAAILAVTAIILSQSRSGWVAMALGIFLFLFSRHHRKFAFTLLCVGFAGFVIILFMTPFGVILQSRLMSLLSLGQDASGNVRSHLNYSGLAIFADGPHFIWGSGTYSFMAHMEGHLHPLMSHDEFYHGGLRMSHNLYITVLAELGILGAAAFILFFRGVFKTLSLLFKDCQSGVMRNALVAILIYLIVKLVDFNLNPDFQDGMFWYLLGMLGAISLIQDRQGESVPVRQEKPSGISPGTPVTGKG